MSLRRCALLVVLAGCGDVGSPVEPGALAQEIIGGSADAGAGCSEVFMVFMTFPDAGSSSCSAVLVGPRTLATAAHCIDPRRRGVTSVRIDAINRATDQGVTAADVYRMSEYRLHPGFDPLVESAVFDIAMVLLERRPDAGPLPISRVAPQPGQPITLAGYGRNSTGQPSGGGVRRAVQASVTSLDGGAFGFGVPGTLGICGGDSGGPSLSAARTVVGLHSTTPDPLVCGDGEDTRVDFHAAFIDAFLAEKDPLPYVDAGPPDAGPPDAGASDAGVGRDAGTGIDAGTGEDPTAPGCGCSSASGGVLSLLLVLGRALRRRRIRTE